MKNKKVAALILGVGLILSFTTPAHARVFITAGYGGYYPAPYYYGPAYYPGYYVAPPPVVYAPPPQYYAPPQQTVIYTSPPAPTVAPTPAPADVQNTPTYIDGAGRTCRQYQAASGTAPSTACLQPDGTWQIVQ